MQKTHLYCGHFQANVFDTLTTCSNWCHVVVYHSVCQHGEPRTFFTD